MLLRKIKIQDAPLMLEWMHDKDVTKDLRADFSAKTLEDVEQFISSSWQSNTNYHLAIVSNEDEYMGTVSLKNIQNSSAEFAIAIRKKAMGKGYSSYAIKEMIRKGIEEKQLKKIYWCVNPLNERAIRFYDKNGFMRTTIDNLNIPEGEYSLEDIQNYIWYLVQT